MGFDVKQYAAQKRSTSVGNAITPGQKDNNQSFSIRKYAADKQVVNGGAQAKAGELQTIWNDVKTYGDNLTAEQQKRQGQYWASADFGTYADGRQKEANVLYSKVQSHVDYWTRNEKLVNENSQTGTAGTDMLNMAKGMLEYLTGAKKGLQGQRDYWAQFENEEQWNWSRPEYVEQQNATLAELKTRQALVQKDVDAYEDRFNSFQDHTYVTADYSSALEENTDLLGRIETLESKLLPYNMQNPEYIEQMPILLADLQEKLKIAENTPGGIHEAERLRAEIDLLQETARAQLVVAKNEGLIHHYSSLPNFEEIAAKGADPEENINWWASVDPNSEQGKDVRSNFSDSSTRNMFIREEELKVYNYLRVTYGQDKADEYIKTLSPLLDQRLALQKKNDVQSMAAIPEFLATTGMSIEAGLHDFGKGWAAVFTGEEQKQSVTQMTQAMLAQDSNWLGKAYYGGMRSVGNMLPMIVVSKLTGGLGTAAGLATGTVGKLAAGAGALTMFGSSAGNAYSQALSEGWKKEDAQTYGFLVGASEALLQYAIGGIGALNGVSETKVLTWTKGIENAFVRVAATGVVKIGREVIEEELQLFLEPLFESMVTGADYDLPTWSEIAQTALATIISTGLLETGGIVGLELDYKKYGKMVNSIFTADELLAEARLMPYDSGAYHLAAKMNPANMSENAMGRLLSQMVADGWVNKETTQRMIEKGLASEDGTANLFALALQSKMDNGKKVGLPELLYMQKMTASESNKNTATKTEAVEVNAKAEEGDAVSQKAPESAGGISIRMMNVGDVIVDANGTELGTVVSVNHDGVRVDNGNQIQTLTEEELQSSMVGEDGKFGYVLKENGDEVSAAPANLGMKKDAMEMASTNNEGGTIYGENRTAQGGREDATAEGAGADVLSRNGRGTVGESAGEQAGSDSAGGRNSAQAEQSRRIAERGNRETADGNVKCSAKELFASGTDKVNLTRIAEENYDDEMLEVDTWVYEMTGIHPVFVLGTIEIYGADGKICKARGVYDGNIIVLQANHTTYSLTQLARHEVFHHIDAMTPKLRAKIRAWVKSLPGGEEMLQKIVNTYVANLDGLYVADIENNPSKLKEATEQAIKELFADAYAGINAFGANAISLQSGVETLVAENYRMPTSETAAATERTTGPPESVRYSIDRIVGDSGTDYGVGVRLDSTFLANLTESERVELVIEYIKELGGSELLAYDSNGNAVKIRIEEYGKKFKNKSGNRVSVNKDLSSYLKNEVKQEAIVLIDELVQTASYQGSEIATHKHDWLDDNGRNKWDLWKTYIQDKQNAVWEASLRIANSTNGQKILYDIYPIKMVEGAGTSATTTTNNNLTHTSPNVNTARKGKTLFSYDGDGKAVLEERVSGDALLDAQDLIETVQAVGAEVDSNGYITVYHRTSAAVAEKIQSTGRMTAKEDGLFFSTVEQGQNEGYGDTAIRLRIPAEVLVLDDIFDNEAHLRLPLENGRRSMDVSAYLDSAEQSGETIKDASKLSRSDLRDLLETVQNGGLSDGSYIPLRRNTPEFFIGVVEAHSEGRIVVEDHPLISEVEHLRQNMEEEDGQSYGNARPHGFSPDDIITISEKMGDPSYIVLQKNGRYAEVVSFYNNRKKQVIVVVDFADSSSNPPKNYKYPQYMNGFGGGYYNVVVTQYEHDNFERYLKGCEIVYNKKEMNGRYQVGSGRVVTVTHDTPFIEDIIADNEASVKESRSNSDDNNRHDGKASQETLFSYDGEADVDAENTADTNTKPATEAEALEQEIARLTSSNYLHGLLDESGPSAVVENQKQVEKLQKRLERIRAKETKEVQQPKERAQQQRTAPIAESKPVLAAKDLRKKMLDLFSIPEGMKAEMGNVIDAFGQQLLKKGSLTTDDYRWLFRKLYSEGVMEVEADEYKHYARNEVIGHKIYVNDLIREEFGEDWSDFRRRAFGAGVMLVNDRTAPGVDVWNQNFAEILPGLFDANEYDARTILEQIVQVAEDGKSENMSIAEYMQMLASDRVATVDEQLADLEKQVLDLLKNFAEKAELEIQLRDRTGIQIAMERKRNREAMERTRQNKELREMQQKTLKQLQWLSKNRNRAPEDLRARWEEVLSDIDIYAVGAADEMRWSERHQATWRDLAEMYKEAQENDPNFLPSKELEKIVARLDNAKIGDMDIDALQDLYRAAIGLRTEFYNRNNVINDKEHRLFAEVFDESKEDLEKAAGKFTGKKADKFFNLQQLTPMNVLQRMVGWKKDGAWMSMARQLEQGERDMKGYEYGANRFLADFLTEHEDWVRKADGQGKDGIWYEIKVPELLALELGKEPDFGATQTVYMTPAQKIQLYLESRSSDNLRHMTGGRTFVDKKLYSEGKRQEAFAQGKTIRLAPETVKAIVADMTDVELELARLLEQYYNSFAKDKINAVSNVLYGYDKAMSGYYAPIFTNQNYVKTEIGTFDVTAEGVGHMKTRQYAVNPSYNIGAFDAFERHVDQTARFVGMAIPARNWNTLLSWRVKNNSTGDVITHKWGEESKQYIENLLEKLQAGDHQKTTVVDETLNKLYSNYIAAVFGANPSIVLKQLGSIPLASAYLDLKNVPNFAQLRSIDQELIAKYTPELGYRTMGYATPETKVLKDNPNWTQKNKVLRFALGGGAITAMDGWASSVLWPWAENKVRRDFPDLEVGTREQVEAGESPFYKKVAELFNEALTRTQSISDEIHQSSLRKSKNPISRAFTMFKSDAAQGYNVLRQKIGEAQYLKENGGSKAEVVAASKKVGGAFLSIITGYVYAQAITLLINMWKHKGKKYRDDEDELTAESIAKEMTFGLVSNMAGVVVGGEELTEIIGILIMDKKWYGIDTPGMEQLVGMVKDSTEVLREGSDIIKGAVNILQEDGDLGEYFRKHAPDLLGDVKNIAKTLAMNLAGVPVENLEAYLLGLVKWVAPELATAYEDAFESANKSGLKGLDGAALEQRVENVFENRTAGAGIGKESAEVVSELYDAGFTGAVPSATPEKFSMDGAEVVLSETQQQTIDKVWHDTVPKLMEQIVTSDEFLATDDEYQEKVLKKLYDYATQLGKAKAVEGYAVDPWVEDVMKDSDPAGRLVTDALNGTGGAEGWLRIAELPLQDSMKKEMLQDVMNEKQMEQMQIALSGGFTVYEYCKFRYDVSERKLKKKDEVLSYIDGMAITKKEKDTLYLAMGYAKGDLRKAPWR